MWEHGLGVEFIRQVIQGGTLGELEETKDSRLSAKCKRSTQGVEAYMYAGGDLG